MAERLEQLGEERKWMHAQRSCTVSKKTRTSPRARSNRRDNAGRKVQTTQCKRKRPSAHVVQFCRCYQQQRHTLKETAAQVMIPLCGLQWYARTRGQTRHFSQEGKEYQDAKIDGQTEQNIVSACKKPAARTKPWNVGIKLQVNLRKPPAKWRRSGGKSNVGTSGMLFKLQLEDVQRDTNASTSWTWTSSPRSMNHQSTQRATLSQAGSSSVQAQWTRTFFLLLGTRPRILRSEREVQNNSLTFSPHRLFAVARRLKIAF